MTIPGRHAAIVQWIIEITGCTLREILADVPLCELIDRADNSDIGSADFKGWTFHFFQIGPDPSKPPEQADSHHMIVSLFSYP